MARLLFTIVHGKHSECLILDTSYCPPHSYEDISTLLEIEEELDELEQLTVIQLGDSSSSGEIPIVTAKLSGKEKDKKKSKSKLKSGKQTKSTVKPSVSGKKAVSTNTAPTSRKKALQGLLILRPSSNSKVAVTARDVSSASEDSDADSDGGSSAQFDGKRKTGKRDRAQEVSLTPFSSSLPTLIVGRSSKQNDRITFEIAKEHHLWFHVQVRCGVRSSVCCAAVCMRRHHTLFQLPILAYKHFYSAGLIGKHFSA